MVRRDERCDRRLPLGIRPGGNVDHIRDHGLSTGMWEALYLNRQAEWVDKDDATITVAESRLSGRLYRIVYEEDQGIMPIAVIPITGFPVTRRALRGNHDQQTSFSARDERQ